MSTQGLQTSVELLKNVWVFVSLLAAIGCGGNSTSTSPSSGLNVGGTWNGTLAEVTSFVDCPNSWVGEFCGVGHSTWTLTQNGNAVSGTFTLKMTCSVCAFDDSHGSVTGTLSGNTLSFTLNASFTPPMPFTATVNGTAQVTATNMNGTYSGTISIPGYPFTNGQLALVKQ